MVPIGSKISSHASLPKRVGLENPAGNPKPINESVLLPVRSMCISLAYRFLDVKLQFSPAS